MSVPKKYIDDWDEFKETHGRDWKPTYPTKYGNKRHGRQQLHRKYNYNVSDRIRKFKQPKRNHSFHSSKYYYVPYNGRPYKLNEKGTLSSMKLINNPDLLKNPPLPIQTHQDLCFFKIKNLTENYLVNLNNEHLKIVTDQKIKQVKKINLNTVPIQYPKATMDKYNMSILPQPLNKFVCRDFNLAQDKSGMSSFIIKEIAQRYEHTFEQKLNADFMSSASSLKHICHVIMSNIMPGKYKLQDPLYVLIWPENSVQSIDPKPWNKNIIQLHHITTDERWEPNLFDENPNAMYGHLFEYILTKDRKSKFFKYMEVPGDESNAFVLSKMKLFALKDKSCISLLLMSEQDCRASAKNDLAEIKLSKIYTFDRHSRYGIALNRKKTIRIPFWKFMSYWAQCYFGHKTELIIGFHKNGKINNILRTNFESIMTYNQGLREKISFVKSVIFEVLEWIKKCVNIHSAVTPLLLKTQLAIDNKGNAYNQFIVKQLGGKSRSVSKLKLTKLLEYGQKTHNIYFDSEIHKFHIQKVNFYYVQNILKKEITVKNEEKAKSSKKMKKLPLKMKRQSNINKLFRKYKKKKNGYEEIAKKFSKFLLGNNKCDLEHILIKLFSANDMIQKCDIFLFSVLEILSLFEGGNSIFVLINMRDVIGTYLNKLLQNYDEYNVDMYEEFEEYGLQCMYPSQNTQNNIINACDTIEMCMSQECYDFKNYDIMYKIYETLIPKYYKNNNELFIFMERMVNDIDISDNENNDKLVVLSIIVSIFMNGNNGLSKEDLLYFVTELVNKEILSFDVLQKWRLDKLDRVTVGKREALIVLSDLCYKLEAENMENDTQIDSGYEENELEDNMNRIRSIN